MPISLSKWIGPDSFSVVWSSLHLLHNEPVTFPALPVPIYTPGWGGIIMVKCLTQGHNTLTVTGLERTTFCLWIQHWSARPHAPMHSGQSTHFKGWGFEILKNCKRVGVHIFPLKRVYWYKGWKQTIKGGVLQTSKLCTYICKTKLKK